MNWLDIVILVSLVASFIGGIAIGFIRGLVSLIGLILGIVLAGKYYTTVSVWFDFIPNQDISDIVAFILIMLAVTLLAGLIVRLLHRLTSATLTGWIDHLIGGILGVFGAFISWSALLALWVKFVSGDSIASSTLAQVMLDKLPVILSLLPSQFDSIRNFFN
jgi:membrane protein required for colicin V production